MYEPAADLRSEILPLWHVGEGRSLFIGPLEYNAPHAHSVPVFITGLYAPFGLRLAGEDWIRCWAAVIPAGTPYELDVGGSPLSVLYLEPSIAGVEALIPLVRNARAVGSALVGTSGERPMLRDLYEHPASGGGWTEEALGDLLGFAQKRARRELDRRISRAIAAMSESGGEPARVVDCARSVGLSPSRFQHLFAEEIGVSFRRYRVWQRLRAAIREVTNGSNLTVAAHAAGFFDQAHFSRSFRRTFGAPASQGLRKTRGPRPTDYAALCRSVSPR